MPKAPEQQAREKIDVQLAECGWIVQDFRKADFAAGRGIALREVRLKSGPCDYLLFVDRIPVGVIEAKKEGTRLSVVADQSTNYAQNLPEYLGAGLNAEPPFRYESTGVETFFRDERDPFPRSRRVFTFHRPETLGEWAAETDTLRSRLVRMRESTPLATLGMRDCQVEAIQGLERSFFHARPRALIHMATGAGKTFTACAFIYRLIKYAGARRILFLGLLIDHRSKASRAARQAVLDADLDYTPADLDRSVVVPDQIRTVLSTYRDIVFTELFPGRTLLPKTLIFAKDDSHAEDIVHICREVFGRGNDFCKKITYQAKHPVTGKPAKSKELISEFRLSPTLRIAVTVDMIATGTDVKPIEVLIFLRDVRSRVYFEQMKGRGTRVLTATDLQAVSGAEAQAKTHLVIVDAVGVCESDKTESRPLDRHPTMPLKTLLQRVIFPGGRDGDTLTTLASRLARLDRQLDANQRAAISAASGGETPATLAAALLRANDPDAIAERASGDPLADVDAIPREKVEAARAQLVTEACAPFDKPALRETLENLKRETEQAIDIFTLDEVASQGFDAAAKDKAAGLVESFRDYLATHQAEIDALQILYSTPYKQRLTEDMLKELEKKLRETNATFTEDRLWDAFAVTTPAKVRGRSKAGRFADLVALVRFALERQPVLAPFADSVQERYEQWLQRKEGSGAVFTSEQKAWLSLIRDHIATSLSIEPADFDYSPFTQRGGLGKAHQLFGAELPRLLEELNEVLAA